MGRLMGYLVFVPVMLVLTQILTSDLSCWFVVVSMVLGHMLGFWHPISKVMILVATSGGGLSYTIVGTWWSLWFWNI